MICKDIRAIRGYFEFVNQEKLITGCPNNILVVVIKKVYQMMKFSQLRNLHFNHPVTN